MPDRVKAGQPFAVTGLAQVGLSGLKHVQYWLHPAAKPLAENDPYLAKAPWQDAIILPPPEKWGRDLPDGKLPPVMQIDPKNGKPFTWPIPNTIVHWAALVPAPRPASTNCVAAPSTPMASPSPCRARSGAPASTGSRWLNLRRARNRVTEIRSMFPQVSTVALLIFTALGGLTAAIAQEADEAGGKTKGPPKELAVDLGGGVKLEMVLVPAGSFLMGGERETPVHKVNITKPFYLGKYAVTQEQWQAVMGSNPSYFKGARNPVDWVNWDDCQRFLDKLNGKSRPGGGKFQLPTEAQREYACRAGSTAKYCFGDDDARLGDYAWYSANWGIRRTRWAARSQTPLGFTICTAIYGSGARIGTIRVTMRNRRRTIRGVRQRACTACCVAGVGSLCRALPFGGAPYQRARGQGLRPGLACVAGSGFAVLCRSSDAGDVGTELLRISAPRPRRARGVLAGGRQ